MNPINLLPFEAPGIFYSKENFMFYGKPVLPFQFDKHFATTDLVAKVKPSRDLFNHIDSLMFNFLS